MEASRVIIDPDGDEPSIRVEANRPHVVGVTMATIAALIVGFVALSRSKGLLAVALFVFVFIGAGFLYVVGPARVISRSWIAADRSGLAARTTRGIIRFGWDRIISVHRQFAGRPLARYTIVEVRLKLGEPDDPFGPINPFEAYLWFLSRKRRSLEIGREFLSICRRYGSTTRLLVGRVREP